MFCVECGAEGKTYEGVCLKCLTDRRALIRLPEYVDIPQCKRCGHFQAGTAWAEMEVEDAIRNGVARREERDALVSGATLTALAVEPEDAMNFRVRAEYAITLADDQVPWEAATKVRLKAGVCPTCSRRAGGYYEAILQVRGDGRDLTGEESETVRALVQGALGARPDDFVTREEAVNGGLDLYLSSKALAKRLAAEIQRSLGGLVGTSSSLHTRRAGRDVYRMTYLIRIPGYAPGDVVEVEGRLRQVGSVGDSVTLIDLATGESDRVEAAALTGVTPRPVETADAVVVSREGDEAQLLDPVTFATVRVPLVAPLPDDAEEVPVIRLEGALYLDLVRLAAKG